MKNISFSLKCFIKLMMSRGDIDSMYGPITVEDIENDIVVTTPESFPPQDETIEEICYIDSKSERDHAMKLLALCGCFHRGNCS